MKSRNHPAALLTLLIPIRHIVPDAEARVVRVEVLSREDLLNGKTFGAIGGYEKITARVHYALDPANPDNRAIVDLGTWGAMRRPPLLSFASGFSS